MHGIDEALVGDWHRAVYAALKAVALFVTAVVALRLTERRTLSQFAPFDWVAAVAAGAIVGRTATATDAPWLTGAAALVALLMAHAAVARLRFLPAVQRLVDPPLRVLIYDGTVDHRNLKRCGLTGADLEAIMRQHGYRELGGIHIALFEAKGSISIVGQPSGPVGGARG